MANNQTNRRKRDIKTKLMAAVSMLLVSSIMMVSTTYAWFTLSTAPEVKGITTAVGANGNLEMALLPENGLAPADSTIADGGHDSIAAKNITWGNLVDLSDTTTYGLDKITLFPSELNLSAGSSTLAAAFLKTPTYGADGRVSELLANTVTGLYNGQTFMPSESKGVRAVGVASGMTDRQLDYRNARSAGNTAKATALNLASQSLTANGSALADIAIAHGLAKDGAVESYTQTDVGALKAIVNDLETKILPEIEKAYLQYILAYAASAASDDAKWTAVKGAVTAETATLNSVITALGSGNAMPSALSTAIEKYNTTKATVTAASGELAALSTATDATFSWEQIRSPMDKLVNTTKMKINNFTVSEIVADPNKLVNSVMSGGGGLELTMETGAGVYADIADQCGDFTASITIKKVEYGGMQLEQVPARMATKTSVRPVYLDAINTAVEGAGAPAGAAANSMPITDMYGYIIDLAFRTNAAESNLLLQVDAKDRIYSDNTNDDTMGGGSSMTFKAITTDFSDAKVKELMKAIRIVFFNPDESNKVIANAKLHADTATPTADGWKAEMYIYTVEEGRETEKTDRVIMPLTQNTVAKLSVLVYLDGNSVGNDDVAATAASSMTGKMNIQFASSANLIPMEYADLHQGTGTGSGTGNTNATAMTAVTVPDGASYKVSNPSFTDKTISVKLADSSDAAITTGTVTFTVAGNNTPYPATCTNGVWSATVTETLAANTAVTVTYTAG